MEFLVRPVLVESSSPPPPLTSLGSICQRGSLIISVFAQAEDSKITIIPKFKYDTLKFISVSKIYLHRISRFPLSLLQQGDFGPFRPQTPVDVPLWLAVTLKKRQKCQIQQPEWMDLGNLCGSKTVTLFLTTCALVEYLGAKLENEKSNDEFEDLPFHFLEIVSVLFNS
jgi:GINS complex subunit 2